MKFLIIEDEEYFAKRLKKDLMQEFEDIHIDIIDHIIEDLDICKYDALRFIYKPDYQEKIIPAINRLKKNLI